MLHGRPSRSAQLQVQQKLRKYYDLGVSARIAAQKTGINIKTAAKYFDEWTEQIMEKDATEFFDRQRQEKTRTVNTYDLLIIEAGEMLEEMNDAARNLAGQGKPADVLYSTRLRAMQFLAELTEKRAAITMRPEMDEVLKSKIQEMLNNAKNRQNS